LAGETTVEFRMLKRRRFKQTEALEVRLARESECLHEEAERLPLGVERERVLRKIQQMDMAFEIIEWLRSPGGQVPGRELADLLRSGRKSPP